MGEVPKSFSCRPGRSRKAFERRGCVCSAGREETSGEVVPPRATNRPGGGVAGEGRGCGGGDRPPAATPTDLGAESADRGEKILPHQRATTHRPASRAAGRVRALECGTCVPRGQERSRPDPLRGTQLCIVETSLGVVPGSLGFRQFAHEATAGGKIRRSLWSRFAEPSCWPVGNT